MCFIQTKESKLLVAKRDIKVYKIGKYVDTTEFISLYKNFVYRTCLLEQRDVDFSKYSISQGLHSFINLNIIYSDWCVKISTVFNSIHEIVLHGDLLAIGEFIIPKNSKYILNNMGEVVSNSLMYTGRCLNFIPTSSLKIKELWKDK